MKIKIILCHRKCTRVFLANWSIFNSRQFILLPMLPFVLKTSWKTNVQSLIGILNSQSRSYRTFIWEAIPLIIRNHINIYIDNWTRVIKILKYIENLYYISSILLFLIEIVSYFFIKKILEQYLILYKNLINNNTNLIYICPKNNSIIREISLYQGYLSRKILSIISIDLRSHFHQSNRLHF